MSRRDTIRRLATVLSAVAILALVLIPATVQAARKHRAATLAATFAITVDFDADTVTATTDQYGWLREDTPCVRGWISLGPGTSTVGFYDCGPGDYTFTITSTGDADGAWVDLYSVTVTE